MSRPLSKSLKFKIKMIMYKEIDKFCYFYINIYALKI